MIGIYAAAVASGVGFAVTAAVNSVFLIRRLGRPQGLGKIFGVCSFSVPLAVLGLFLTNLLSPYLGNTVTIILIAAVMFAFFAVFVTVFGIVDVRAFLSMVLPRRQRARTRA